MSKKITTVFLEEAAVRYALASLFGVILEKDSLGGPVFARPCTVDMPPRVKLLEDRLHDEAIIYFRGWWANRLGMAGADFPVQEAMENREAGVVYQKFSPMLEALLQKRIKKDRERGKTDATICIELGLINGEESYAEALEADAHSPATMDEVLKNLDKEKE